MLTGIHAWLGLHVLARGVVFVDLSLAQVAALGLTVAILAGHGVQSDAGYWYALAFAVGGAVLFALARPYEKALQQEALIGIVYAVSASLGVLALDRAPQGAEHIKQLLIGSILTVTAQDVGLLAAGYALIGIVHAAFRRPLLETSFHPMLAAAHRRNVLLWDVFFYGSFAVVVTSSVRIAGVLLVFSYLIVPAALASLFASSLRTRLLLAWAIGSMVTAVGLAASWEWDLPTGPAIVSAFGAAAAALALWFFFRRITAGKALTLASSLLLLAGLVLVAAPTAHQPWLDAVPGLEAAFLDAGERTTRRETLASIDKARAELARLQALEQDVRWGRVEMPAQKIERLRQYLAGRGEISAGDRLVLEHLRGKARERQRFVLGLPLLLSGFAGFAYRHRGRERRRLPAV